MSNYDESDVSETRNLSISCSDVPVALLDKNKAKNYFKQFGKVLRIRLLLKQKMCIVEFADEESAQKAYNQCGEYNGDDFIISWTKPKSVKKKQSKNMRDVNHWSDDFLIKEELEAMKGSFPIERNVSLRTEAMGTEKNSNSTKKSVNLKTISKNRQWKSEKLKKSKHTESIPSLPNQDTEQEMELLKIIMTAAISNEDKYRILDIRDKLIRLKTVCQSDDTLTVYPVGTCPDMCPEKERLMREVKYQVAPYEQLEGKANKHKMNHSLAVKQYSRSSANQEAPLPHELRPVQVLQMTMSYLLHRIMDLIETDDVNITEWYHFLWDRMRGIRKDITQQQLCCENSVQLVEQCARFHVHCAARLVAEDASVFDNKINSENLTKCLQTLKYMYHDLKVKHGISCPNEAEFRAYIVLLNLNDGNFMWEVQQLSRDIQQSTEIKFAFKIYSALDKNNYVRFFKLVQSTTYLNACILLRYFNQVRYRALLAINKSYSPRLPFPLEELYDVLAFEDEFNTIAFVEYHGLQLNEEKTHVFLDKHRCQHPGVPFALERAINLVESKRLTSVGEVVCGQALPDKLFETHIPYNSFDENGYLKIEDVPKEFQDKYQQFLKQTGQQKQLDVFEFKDEEMADDKMDNDECVTEKEKTFSFTSTTNAPGLFTSTTNVPGFFTSTTNVPSLFTSTTNAPGLFTSTTNAPGLFTSTTNASSLFTNTTNAPSLFKSTTNAPSLFNISKSQDNKPKFGGFKFQLPTPINKVVKDVSEPDGDITSIFGVLKNKSSENASQNLIGQSSLFKSSVTVEPKPNINSSIFSKTFVENKNTNSIQGSANVPKQDDKKINTSFNFKFPNEEPKIVSNSTPPFFSFKTSQPVEQKKIETPTDPIINQLELLQEQKLKELKQKREEEQEREAKRLVEETRLKELLKLQEIKRAQEIETKQRQAELEGKMKADVVLIMNNLISKVEEIVIQHRLEKIAENIKRRRILQFGRKWKNAAFISRKKRKNFFDNSVWVSSRSVTSEAKELLIPSQNLTLHDAKRYKLGTSSDILIKQSKTITKLDIFNLVWKILFEHSTDELLNLNLYWKIGISVPHSSETDKGLTRLDVMLQSALNWINTENGLMSAKKVGSNNGGSLTYCLKKLQVHENNLNGLLFINIGDISHFNLNRFNKVIYDKQLTRIHIPLAILIKNDYTLNKNVINQQLNLPDLVNKQIVSKYEIFLYNENNFEQTLKKSLIFLAENYIEYTNNLEMNELRNVLRNCIGDEFWVRIKSSCSINQRFAVLLQHPNEVIHLHNEALNKCLKLLFDKSVYMLPSFPNEFIKFVKQQEVLLPCTYEYFPEYWNSQSYLHKLKNIVEGLRLPKFMDDWPPTNETDLQEILGNYCKSLFQNMNIIYKILSVALLKYNNNSNIWMEIVELIILEKLNLLQLNDCNYSIYTVVYNLNAMKDFRKVPWWFQIPHIQQGIKNIKHQEEFDEPEIIIEDNSEDELDLDKTISELKNKEISVEDTKMQFEINTMSYLLDDLSKSMEIQKKIMTKFEEIANKTLDS